MGYILALITSTLTATHDIFFSGSIKSLGNFHKLLLICLVSMPFFAIGLAGVSLLGSSFSPMPIFWAYVLIHGLLMVCAGWLYMNALKMGPVSQTQVILALTPVFLIITTPLMTDDSVSILGWVGVIMVAAGIYGTQHPGRKTRFGFWAPLRELWKQPGVKSKLGVAAIYSITANLDRLCLESAYTGTPVDSIERLNAGFTFLLFHKIAIILFVIPIMFILWKKNGNANVHPKRVLGKKHGFRGVIWVIGFLHAMEVTAQVFALTFLTVPAVIAIKRLSIVWVSLWGYGKRKERELTWYRLIGLVLVVAGAGFIMLFGKM